MIGRGPTQQFGGDNSLRRERNKSSRSGFIGRDCLIEVAETGYATRVEQDVRSGDVSVYNATPMDVSKRPAQLPGCTVEIGERYL